MTKEENQDVTSTEVASIEELQAQIELLTQDLESQKDKAMRALADLENFRRREAEQRQQWGKMAVGGFLSNLAPRLFELQKGLDHLEDETYKSVVTTFFSEAKKSGMELIEPEAGTIIDPNKHEVLLTAEGDPGTIVQVLEPGLAYQDHTILPAKVSAAPEA